MNSSEERRNVLDKKRRKRKKKKQCFLCQEMKCYQYVIEHYGRGLFWSGGMSCTDVSSFKKEAISRTRQFFFLNKIHAYFETKYFDFLFFPKKLLSCLIFFLVWLKQLKSSLEKPSPNKHESTLCLLCSWGQPLLAPAPPPPPPHPSAACNAPRAKTNLVNDPSSIFPWCCCPYS